MAWQEQLVGRQQKVLYRQDMKMLPQIEIRPISNWSNFQLNRCSFKRTQFGIWQGLLLLHMALTRNKPRSFSLSLIRSTKNKCSNPPPIIITKRSLRGKCLQWKTQTAADPLQKTSGSWEMVGEDLWALISKGLYRFSCNAPRQIARSRSGTGDHILSKNDSSLQFGLIHKTREASSG